MLVLCYNWMLVCTLQDPLEAFHHRWGKKSPTISLTDALPLLNFWYFFHIPNYSTFLKNFKQLKKGLGIGSHSNRLI